MSEENVRPSQQPSQSTSAPPSASVPQPKRQGWIVAGFCAGVALWLMTLLPWPGYNGIAVLLFDCYVLPPIAVILAAIPRTRRFGLGLLLASGLGWLVLGAMCAGLFR